MSKKNNRARTQYEYRTPLERIITSEEGVKILELGCPFCEPPVHIEPGVPCKCGAKIEMIVSRLKLGASEPIECIICGKSGGTLLHADDGWKHSPSCLIPERKILVP